MCHSICIFNMQNNSVAYNFFKLGYICTYVAKYEDV